MQWDCLGVGPREDQHSHWVKPQVGCNLQCDVLPRTYIWLLEASLHISCKVVNIHTTKTWPVERRIDTPPADRG